MKINKNYFKLGLITLTLSLFILSCSEEDFNIEENEAQNVEQLEQIGIVDGRLYFENRDVFSKYHDEMKDKEENEIADILEKDFYSKGFYSLSPILNEKTEKKEFKRHFSKIQKQQLQKSNNIDENDFLDNFDDLEEIFGESVFQSFLNQNAELRIADTIYQYTDHGLFKVQYNKYQKLVDFENTKQRIHKLSDVNRIESRNPCDIGIYVGNPNGGQRIIAEDVTHYMAEIMEYPCDDLDDGGNPGTGNPGNGGTPTPTVNETYSEIANISQSLDSCSGSEPFLPNLFGTVKVCIDKYESKRRVKTKYWDVDFGLGFSIGVKVKHQKKGWTGIWRKQNADRIALGVNSISWKFDIPTPIYPQTTNYARVYADGLAWEIVRDQSWDYSLGSVAVPNIPIGWGVDALIEFEVSGYEVSVNSPIPDEEQIRTVFYGGLFNQVKDLMRRERNKELTKIGLIVKSETHMYVQIYDFSNYCSNCKKERLIFDWGIATPQINYTFGNGSSNTSISYQEMNFNQPRSTGANVFGMAKRNGTWHGSRLIFEENN